MRLAILPPKVQLLAYAEILLFVEVLLRLECYIFYKLLFFDVKNNLKVIKMCINKVY